MNSECMASRLIIPSLLASIWAKASCTDGRGEGTAGERMTKKKTIHPSESKCYPASQYILGCPRHIHDLSQLYPRCIFYFSPQSITPNSVPAIYVITCRATICISQVSYRSNQENRSTAPSTVNQQLLSVAAMAWMTWAPRCLLHSPVWNSKTAATALLCCPIMPHLPATNIGWKKKLTHYWMMINWYPCESESLGWWFFPSKVSSVPSSIKSHTCAASRPVWVRNLARQLKTHQPQNRSFPARSSAIVTLHWPR